MIHHGARALVVDPGDAAPVLAALAPLGLQLDTILVTHHHGDHVGGLETLLTHFPDVIVHGPAHERMPVPVKAHEGGDGFQALGIDWRVIDVPGHTAGHIAYTNAPIAGFPNQPSDEDCILFCGDTLFSGGCGRLFEGTPSQMRASLSRLSELPSDTKVCCAHEYTLSNLKFALAVDPENRALRAYEHDCQDLRARGEPTLPAHLGNELQINPFLRWDQPAIQAAARQRDPSALTPDAVFATIRQWKNEYR